GDGITHEFINGLYKRPDNVEALNKLAVTQIPCGSGNAFSLSTFGTANPALATLEVLKLTEIEMDAMLLQQGHTTSLSFLSQAYGAVADSD
ncbi:diacylglycerol kinase family protein, partial [Lacticaseibacillus paracasei]